MTKQTYRLLRRCDRGGAGDELQLTADEAQQIDNETPGVLERVIPIEVEPAQARVHGEGRPGSRAPAKDAT